MDKIFTESMPYATLVVVVILEGSAMFRFFYLRGDHWKYSYESIIASSFYFSTFFVIRKALWRTKNEDPGYKYPRLEDVAIDTNDPDVAAGKICIKCGYRKEHARIHHCSRCGRCVEYMDHHCAFSDNCVGKKNIRYFVQFTAWAASVLFIAMI